MKVKGKPLGQRPAVSCPLSLAASLRGTMGSPAPKIAHGLPAYLTSGIRPNAL